MVRSAWILTTEPFLLIIFHIILRNRRQSVKHRDIELIAVLCLLAWGFGLLFSLLRLIFLSFYFSSLTVFFPCCFSAGSDGAEECGVTAGWHPVHSDASHQQTLHDDWPLLGNGVRLRYIQMWTVCCHSNPRRRCPAGCVLQRRRTTGRFSCGEGLLMCVSVDDCFIKCWEDTPEDERNERGRRFTNVTYCLIQGREKKKKELRQVGRLLKW